MINTDFKLGAEGQAGKAKGPGSYIQHKSFVLKTMALHSPFSTAIQAGDWESVRNLWEIQHIFIFRKLENIFTVYTLKGFCFVLLCF